MKILIIEWASFGKEDIDDAFRKLGHHIVKFSHPDYDLRHSDDFISSFSAFMEKENADLVFSSNYFPLVSKVCQKFNKLMPRGYMIVHICRCILPRLSTAATTYSHLTVPHVTSSTDRVSQQCITCHSPPLYPALTLWFRTVPFIAGWTVMYPLWVQCMMSRIIFMTVFQGLISIPKDILMR